MQLENQIEVLEDSHDDEIEVVSEGENINNVDQNEDSITEMVRDLRFVNIKFIKATVYIKDKIWIYRKVVIGFLTE